MPRRRRTQKRRRAGLSQRSEGFLITGHDWGVLDLTEGAQFNQLNGVEKEERILFFRELWEDYREVLMEKHLGRHPGTRPWGWWAFEAPEPRRCIYGKLLDAREVENFKREWREHFGTPHGFRTAESLKTVYEPEADYLDRLHLLTDEERGALAVEGERADAPAYGSGAYCSIFSWLKEETK